MSDNDDAVRRFRASMVMDFDAWHDGTPYDLQALAAMTPADRDALGRELAAKPVLDWRDVEALERIGTPATLARIAAASLSQDDHGGARAMRVEMGAAWDGHAEDRFLAMLGAARPMETSLDALFDVAAQHPTPRVRERLLELAVRGAPDMRYAFGAFLLYLHGQADEWYGLDAAHRPHLLGLSDDGAAREAAAAWLRDMIAAPLRQRDTP